VTEALDGAGGSMRRIELACQRAELDWRTDAPHRIIVKGF
jgi:hypothetical protein